MSKSLDICKASLVSLKAELLRKQDEANKAKSFSGDTFIRPIPGAKTPSCLLQSNEGVEKRNAKDLEEEYTPDIENSLKKSRDVLAMKAKLYDKLVKGEMVSEQDKTFLVDFKQKVTENENKTAYPVSSTKENVEEQEKSDPDADLDKYDSGADDDWIDYTDFFGRTRRCLKTDLEFFKKRDQRIEKELEPLTPPPNEMKQQTPITAQKFVKESRNPEEMSELVSSDMRREQLRLKWEEEERKLAQRTDIHYEDIRFDADAFVNELFFIGVFNITVVLIFFLVYLCLSNCVKSSNNPLPSSDVWSKSSSSVEIGIGVKIVASLHKLLAQKQYFTLFAILQSVMGYSLQDFSILLP
ncbi:hypothetical protein AGLY_009583 [Aphis glycines]|uniref:CCDC174 alpha/beta GRSR domain-containing protein n=1 Tax=Aphis glycines TaxID=307491 RepID=A0A6G0TI93_APHGL|nr:hypothetical protein AGLY_009583 [Aphis glycines]